MNTAINLLPWRQQRQRRQSRDLLIKLTIICLFALFLGILVNAQSRRTESELQLLQQSLKQETQRLQELQNQIVALNRPALQSEPLYPIPPRRAAELLNIVAALPLSEGELSELELNASRLLMSGTAESQHEFELVQDYLQKIALFRHVELAQFILHPNGETYFQFHLPYEPEQ
ncbi:hypothetical protein EDC45_1188 [Mesocricetibacter intestinalis]|uniref:Tfp pilus assembly protein PilN n=1 Tax=Mesocricetibacter intestinalis TaxID=1521930 RepID=A0A4R6VCZ2_9PAST|nr:hypothetical protein [Mesocricetibacter intestinalis]TDQ58115.1 hypothetical protein EDC45_1188 [Mesocricetibacter intestinalis]